MAFDNFGITTKGFEMLAAATTGSLIQMVGGRCSQNTIAQANIPSATDSQFLSAPEGTVKAMSVTDTAAQIIIEFSNAGLRQAITIKSFCVRAMSQGSATAYPFAVCSLDNGGITLQPQSVTGVVVRFQVPFDLTFDGASAYIEGIPVGNNASVDMLDRFVSAHSLGDSTTGDAQRIRGEKTFTDPVEFGDTSTFHKNINVTGTATLKSAILPAYGDNELPVGAMTVLARLPSGLNVGDSLQGDTSYKYATLNGLQEPDARFSKATHTYKLLSATNSSCDWAIVLRIA